MKPTDNMTTAVTRIVADLQNENKALKAENEKLKSDLEIQKNLTRMACFDATRAYDEVEKWKQMFYDLYDKRAIVSTDPKVLVIESLPAEREGKDE